jgi:hypothetical protein
MFGEGMPLLQGDRFEVKRAQFNAQMTPKGICLRMATGSAGDGADNRGLADIA